MGIIDSDEKSFSNNVSFLLNKRVQIIKKNNNNEKQFYKFIK